jgi:YHS domain-containing protein
MKKMLLKSILMFVLAVFALPALAIDKPVYSKNGVAIKGYDTVAYFTQSKPVKGSKSITARYMGAKWQFSSEANKDIFLGDPKKYAPQYGGHCAFAIANDKLVSTDPKAFTVVNDKLYLNYSMSVRKRWVKDTPGYIADGDEYWAKK